MRTHRSRGSGPLRATRLARSVPAYSTDYAPGSRGSLEGRVPALTGRLTFWLEVGDRQLLVYGTRAERAAVFPSGWVHAAGTIRDDCIQMADIALPARHIEVLGQHNARAPALPRRRAEQTSPRGCRMPQNCRPSMRIP
jgi:hypothetical protein